MRNKGQKANVTLSEPWEGVRQFSGVIEDFEQERLVLKTEKGSVQIPHELIAKAKLVIEF